MLIWMKDDPGTSEGGPPSLEHYLAMVRRPLLLGPSNGAIIKALRARYPHLDQSPELQASIRDLWPSMPWIWSTEDCIAWIAAALAAEANRTTAEAANTKHRTQVSRARRVYARAHARKPRCEFGGFFSAVKVNLRNAP